MVCMSIVLPSSSHTTGERFSINIYKKWGQKSLGGKKGKNKSKNQKYKTTTKKKEPHKKPLKTQKPKAKKQKQKLK